MHPPSACPAGWQERHSACQADFLSCSYSFWVLVPAFPLASFRLGVVIVSHCCYFLGWVTLVGFSFPVTCRLASPDQLAIAQLLRQSVLVDPKSYPIPKRQGDSLYFPNNECWYEKSWFQYQISHSWNYKSWTPKLSISLGEELKCIHPPD